MCIFDDDDDDDDDPPEQTPKTQKKRKYKKSGPIGFPQKIVGNFSAIWSPPEDI